MFVAYPGRQMAETSDEVTTPGVKAGSGISAFGRAPAAAVASPSADSSAADSTKRAALIIAISTFTWTRKRPAADALEMDSFRMRRKYGVV